MSVKATWRAHLLLPARIVSAEVCGETELTCSSYSNQVSLSPLGLNEELEAERPFPPGSNKEAPSPALAEEVS